MKGRWKKCAILFAVGLAFVALMGIWQGLYRSATVQDAMRNLSDGFCVPGLIYILLGFIGWSTNEGTFDMLGYGVKKAWDAATQKKKEEREDFYEYRQRKREKPKSVLEYLLVGSVLLAIGLIFLLLFYQL